MISIIVEKRNNVNPWDTIMTSPTVKHFGRRCSTMRITHIKTNWHTMMRMKKEHPGKKFKENVWDVHHSVADSQSSAFRIWINKLYDWLTDWVTDWVTDWLIDWWMDGSIELIDWLTHQLIMHQSSWNYKNNSHCTVPVWQFDMKHIAMKTSARWAGDQRSMGGGSVMEGWRRWRLPSVTMEDITMTIIKIDTPSQYSSERKSIPIQCLYAVSSYFNQTTNQRERQKCHAVSQLVWLSQLCKNYPLGS